MCYKQIRVENDKIFNKFIFNKFYGLNYKIILVCRIYMYYKEINQNEIANLFNIDAKALSKILNKNFTFRADRLLMFCNKLNIDISDFYHNVNELMKYENCHDKSFVIKFKYS